MILFLKFYKGVTKSLPDPVYVYNLVAQQKVVAGIIRGRELLEVHDTFSEILGVRELLEGDINRGFTVLNLDGE